MRKRSMPRCGFRCSAVRPRRFWRPCDSRRAHGVEISVNGEHLGGFVRSAAKR